MLELTLVNWRIMMETNAMYVVSAVIATIHTILHAIGG